MTTKEQVHKSINRAHIKFANETFDRAIEYAQRMRPQTVKEHHRHLVKFLRHELVRIESKKARLAIKLIAQNRLAKKG